MKILKMRASFGKLHDTLELHDGLNVLYFPNEAGKSTWSAFLVAMLYGIDTAERATKANAGLPAKERYRPWDGSAMEGTVELEWKGRHITIERTSGRTPMGVFRAFDTDSGLPIPELTAENCGRTLCGVERSVFERTAFVRQLGMEVSADPELEQRLGTLVTAGEENAVPYSKLEKQLHAMQNALTFRVSGQVPKLTAQVHELEIKVSTLRRAQEEMMSLSAELETAEHQLREVVALEQRVLRVQNAQKRMSLTEAEEKLKNQEELCEKLRETCEKLPEEGSIRAQQAALEQAEQGLLTAQMEATAQEPAPIAPELPPCFRRHDPQAALDQVAEDEKEFQLCKNTVRILPPPVFILLGMVLIAFLVIVLFKRIFWAAGVGALLLVLCFVAFLVSCVVEQKNKNKKERVAALVAKYGNDDPVLWMNTAQEYAAAYKRYAQQRYDYDVIRKRFEASVQQAQERVQVVVKAVALYAPDTTNAGQARRAMSAALELQNRWENEERTRSALQQNVQVLTKLLEDVPQVEDPEALRHTPEEMRRSRQRAEETREELSRKLAHKRGEIGVLGDLTRLEASLSGRREELAQAQEKAEIVSLASEVLRMADAEQRSRFSPQITAEAALILSRLTEGKYADLQLHPNLTLSVREQDGAVLRPAAAMSCGTADQMYLALRLAMCHRLLPEGTPLVLDDALVSFDPLRTAQALTVLRQENRQILLFTCRPLEV